MLITKELVGAATKPIMLSILAEGESYGYSIIQRIHDLSGGALELADGTLYPVLHRIEDEGLIESCIRKSLWHEARTNGRGAPFY